MPRPIELAFWGGKRTILKRDAMLIRVTTDTGLKGFAPGPAHEQAANEINHTLQPMFHGKYPHQIKADEFQKISRKYQTCAVVEIAILDLLARYEGCPLSDLLGGRKRENIKIYGSAGMYMTPEEYADEAAAIVSMGFNAYKMRPGIGYDGDLKTIELMRKAVGEDFGLMVDAHTWWRMGDKSYTFQEIRLPVIQHP